MITQIQIDNFKSITHLTLKPGRVTVLIGENGSGKSNILEAIAFAAGAAGNKLDREFLYSRGVRVTDYQWMKSAFDSEESIHICCDVSARETTLDYTITPLYDPLDGAFTRWVVEMLPQEVDVMKYLESQKVLSVVENVKRVLRENSEVKSTSANHEMSGQPPAVLEDFLRGITAKFFAGEKQSLAMAQTATKVGLAHFLIYAPENTVLRAFDPEDAIEPLGSKGQGLLKLLQSFDNESYGERFVELNDLLQTLGWFDHLTLPTADDGARDRIRLSDRLLPPDNATFDQRSANEGFLLLLFYFVLFLSSTLANFWQHARECAQVLQPQWHPFFACRVFQRGAKNGFA